MVWRVADRSSKARRHFFFELHTCGHQFSRHCEIYRIRASANKSKALTEVTYQGVPFILVGENTSCRIHSARFAGALFRRGPSLCIILLFQQCAHATTKLLRSTMNRDMINGFSSQFGARHAARLDQRRDPYAAIPPTGRAVTNGVVARCKSSEQCRKIVTGSEQSRGVVKLL